MKPKKERLIHIGFEIMLLFKALSALGELILSIFLSLKISKTIQEKLINYLGTKLEYDRKIIKLLYKLVTGYSMDMNHFMIVYMLSHGISRLILVILLYKRKLWAYPFSILVLIWFVIYQIYKYIHMHSIFLILLTILDIILIILTYLEYKNKKTQENN